MTGPAGVLLAAGRSRRMGALKQLMPWGTGANSSPLVAASFDALAPHCDAMVVVTSTDEPRVLAALAPREFIHASADGDAEMMESVRAGVEAAMKNAPGRPVLLHPADHPFVHPEIVRGLCEAAAPEADGELKPFAVMPEHLGKGGHPVLISPAALPLIIAWRGTGGLRAFWEFHSTRVVRLAVNDASVLWDIDTPQDLDDAVSRRPPGISTSLWTSI